MAKNASAALRRMKSKERKRGFRNIAIMIGLASGAKHLSNKRKARKYGRN